MGKKILWINPVATNLFDETFKKEFEKVKQPDTMVDVVSLPPASGPTHLEYNCYEVMIMPEILRMIKKAEEEEYDAAIIGCFYDPALRAAREITEKMVVTAPAESIYMQHKELTSHPAHPKRCSTSSGRSWM
ncbi:aspartate/glutamate racemase family protein [Geobacillus thermoleovorans]|uniref:aspartate/glutamate racemase family protein n=1 Tax=Geobacillus thermoleovorans TaxID=33941 RepID=UPI00298A0312|nr:aspartate/glutamate racemase family protein [Geobacillus thermoleovorans]